MLPSFAGTVNTSPRAENTARLPSGEMSNSVMFLLTLVQCLMLWSSVRTEVNRISMPHGKRVSPVRVGHVFAGVVFEIVNRDRLRQTSGVAFPGAKIAKDLVIGDLRPVG